MTETKRRFRVTYTDKDDEGCPEFTCIIRAYNEEHVEELFFEQGEPGDDYWKIVKMEVIRES